MRCIKYSIEPVEVDFEKVPSAKFTSLSVVAPLLRDELPSVNGAPCIVFRDVTYIADNLSKFNNLSDVQQVALVNRLRSAGKGSFDNLTDDELFSFMKSRYAQLPSEIDAYINYVNNNIELIKSDIERAEAAKAAESAAESAESETSAEKSEDVVS